MSKQNMIRVYRLEKAWSQEQLAEFSGVSVRTIQRLEKGGQGALETLKAIAATLDVDIKQLQEEKPDMTHQASVETNEEHALKQATLEVKKLKGFYSHLIQYALVMALLVVINLYTSPNYYWFIWPMLGWGIGIVSHGLKVFGLFPGISKGWEKKQIEKRLKK